MTLSYRSFVLLASFNGRLRDECLNASGFHNLNDAKRKIERWREEYNREAPPNAGLCSDGSGVRAKSQD
jgi:transposase InsO family protein